MQKHRLSDTAFTRNRKLNFTTLVTFLINHRKGASQTELDRFLAERFDDNRPCRHITKSALIQARKKFWSSGEFWGHNTWGVLGTQYLIMEASDQLSIVSPDFPCPLISLISGPGISTSRLATRPASPSAAGYTY